MSGGKVIPYWFRLYYSDGSVHTGTTTEEAWTAPTRGALIVKHHADNEQGWALRTGTFFVWETFWPDRVGRWGSKDDFFGLCRYWEREPGPQKVVMGEEIPDDIFMKIMQNAKAAVIDDGKVGA